MTGTSKTKNDFANLSVYIVDTNWKLLRVINTRCTVYRGDIDIPTITIDDNMICNLINMKEIPFCSPQQGRFNFYYYDIMALNDADKPIDQNISIELLEVGNTYVLLSPGLWTGINDNRRRLCDDGYLYNIASYVSPEVKNDGEFTTEFFNIYHAANLAQIQANAPNVEENEISDETVTNDIDETIDSEKTSVTEDIPEDITEK